MDSYKSGGLAGSESVRYYDLLTAFDHEQEL